MIVRAPRILSIEDDRQVRESIEDWLGDSGFDVITAPDGGSGVDAVREHAPDLVLLDMGLPDMHGLKVLELIHEMTPQTPVVIVSANAHISDAIGAFKAGAWDYVTKPILNFGALEQTILNCLERRDLKQEVRRVQARYRSLLQNLPVVIFTMDADLSIDFINDSCLDVLGYTPGEAMAEPGWFISHVHEHDREEVLAAMSAACTQTNPDFRLGFRFRHKKGYRLHLAAQSLLPENGDPGMGDTARDQFDYGDVRRGGRISGIIFDVTERAFLEKAIVQHEKLNTLGAMSHELAHEIRNPLMSLGGFAKRLADKHPELEEAPIILEQAKRLEALMDRISAYVAPVPVNPQRVSVTAALTFCLDRLAPGLIRRGLDIRPQLDTTISDIFSDFDLLTETLVNILNHLARSMGAADTLVISTRQNPTNVSIEFDLAGTAKAVLPQDPDALLMPFEEDGGTLGMALAYRNLKNLGGILSYTPKEEGGALLIASLPLEL